jgi:hypothetical protein
MMTHIRWPAVTGLFVVLAAAAVAASPQGSLNKCQDTVKTQGRRFVDSYVLAVGTCLQAVSTQIVENNVVSPAAAARQCITQLRKTHDTRGAGKSLVEKLEAKIEAKCAPGGSNTHTLGDILGSGAGVPQPLNAQNLNAWCAAFGGDGSLDTLQEWIDCVTAAQVCTARATLAAQYPRAIEWLALVKPEMQAVPPSPADPNNVSDAVAGLDATKAAIDGGPVDNIPNISCGPAAVCGNGIVESGEQCDGADLGGQTCEGLGYTLGGTLTCNAGCGFNVSGCSGHSTVFPASGQTTKYAATDDGDLEAGGALSYTDNGDGTITDNNAGLMWEKKVLLDSTANGANPHDADNCYVWAGSCSGNSALCGTDADCPSGQSCGAGSPSGCFVGATIFQWVSGLNAANFAGHNDWRVPNVKELQSIVQYGTYYPSVAPAFHDASCGGSCLDMTSPACSCTLSSDYWSSTTYANYTDDAWIVYFDYGYVSYYNKTFNFYVRAVRGGS